MAEAEKDEGVNQEVGVGCADVCPPAGLIGADKYDYKYLCTPSMPWSEGGVAPPKFLAKDERLPLVPRGGASPRRRRVCVPERLRGDGRRVHPD